MYIRTIIASALILLFALKGSSQLNAETAALQKKYTVYNRTICAGTITGSVHFNEGEGPGIAWLTGQTFGYGVVEPLVPLRGKQMGYWVGNGSAGNAVEHFFRH